MKIYVAVMIGLLLVCNSAIADIDYKHYVLLEKMKSAGKAKYGSGAELLDYWLDGVAQGLSWTAAADKSGKKVFCLPEKMALSGDILRSVIQQFFEAHPNVRKDDVYMGAVAVLAVQEAFPCSK